MRVRQVPNTTVITGGSGKNSLFARGASIASCKSKNVFHNVHGKEVENENR